MIFYLDELTAFDDELETLTREATTAARNVENVVGGKRRRWPVPNNDRPSVK
jgi:hypothetical protein